MICQENIYYELWKQKSPCFIQINYQIVNYHVVFLAMISESTCSLACLFLRLFESFLSLVFLCFRLLISSFAAFNWSFRSWKSPCTSKSRRFSLSSEVPADRTSSLISNKAPATLDDYISAYTYIYTIYNTHRAIYPGHNQHTLGSKHFYAAKKIRVDCVTDKTAMCSFHALHIRPQVRSLAYTLYRLILDTCKTYIFYQTKRYILIFEIQTSITIMTNIGLNLIQVWILAAIYLNAKSSANGKS